MKRGKLLVICAPSGTGKSTLLPLLKERFPELKESISYTTRDPRQGEIHGKNYFFCSKEEFLERARQKEFLEYFEVHGNFYGTSRSFVEKELESGHHLLFDLDTQGADALKAFFGACCFVIFLAPPSLEDLKMRLEKRGTESEENKNLRLQNAEKELSRQYDYDARIVNSQLEVALEELSVLVKTILGKTCC